jgi:hypothetical protein
LRRCRELSVLVVSRINLGDLLKRMVGPSRTEATLQCEIHTLLLAADLNIEEAALNDVTLESRTAGRRIEVEVDHVCIEVNKSLPADRPFGAGSADRPSLACSPDAVSLAAVPS